MVSLDLSIFVFSLGKKLLIGGDMTPAHVDNSLDDSKYDTKSKSKTKVSLSSDMKWIYRRLGIWKENSKEIRCN